MPAPIPPPIPPPIPEPIPPYLYGWYYGGCTGTDLFLFYPIAEFFAILL